MCDRRSHLPGTTTLSGSREQYAGSLRVVFCSKSSRFARWSEALLKQTCSESPNAGRVVVPGRDIRGGKPARPTLRSDPRFARSSGKRAMQVSRGSRSLDDRFRSLLSHFDWWSRAGKASCHTGPAQPTGVTSLTRVWELPSESL